MSKEKNEKQNHTSHFTPHTSNKGITLIALIITIVVMLILVAVTLSIALGENGIVNNAKKAARDTNSAMTNDTNIANDVTYDGIQGMDNIVDYLVNRISSRDLKVGDKVRIKVSKNISNDIEEITGNTSIEFDNDMEIDFQIANDSVDKNYLQIIKIQDETNIIISEESPAYIYLLEGTNALGRTIETEGWYKFTDMTNPNSAELITEVPGFEATIEKFFCPTDNISKENFNTSPDCDIYDTYIEFYK